VRWDKGWTKVIPNVAQSFEADADSKEFTFHLRRGMRWSDGAPFTADDIMFWYQDVYLKPELKPTHFIFLNGMEEQFTVKKVDDYTVVFTFDKPYGLFLQQMATMSGAMMTLYPQHYLKQFHPDYNPDIAVLIEQEGVKDWVELFNKHRDGSVGSIHPGTPALFAWMFEAGTTISGTPGDTFSAVRNPYYWKIDTDFNQLPYIDQVEFTVVEDNEAATALAIAGQVDMQDRHMFAAAFTPENIKRGGYGTYKLLNTLSNAFVISFNQNSDDPVKREIFQNRDFRIGLSYAINRPAIIAASGLAVEPFQVAPIEGTPFYDEQMAFQYTEYNVDEANRYLDQAGYSARDAEGFRLGPDGKRIQFTLVIPDPYLYVSNIELYASQIQADWRAVGVDMQVKFTPRIEADTLISDEKEEFNQYDALVRWGEGGYDVIMNAGNYLPKTLNHFAPRWGTWYDNPQDPNAEEPPVYVQQQQALYRQILETADSTHQEELMKQILTITAEQFYTIGIHSMPVSYGIVQSNFHNVPQFMFGSWTYPNPAPTNPCQYFIDPQPE
jgi:peptide/nickel transport system substrate-binding protein